MGARFLQRHRLEQAARGRVVLAEAVERAVRVAEGVVGPAVVEAARRRDHQFQPHEAQAQLRAVGAALGAAAAHEPGHEGAAGGAGHAQHLEGLVVPDLDAPPQARGEQLEEPHLVVAVRHTEGIEPMRLLTTEAKTAEWMNEGLPADRISIENGAIITNCNRWPLIIDPQLQGLKWIRAHEEARLSRGKKKPPAEDAAGDGAEAPAEGDDAAPAAAAPAAAVTGITQLQLGEKNWVFKVTEAIRLGHVAIIENLGQSIDAVMDPVLSRAVVRKGRTLFIRMGGEDLEYDPDFRLYLQTRLANPHYKPEIAAQCTLINFIVTEGGLEEQLLAKVVSREQPDLEKQKNELVQAFNRYKIQLKSLEDDLLYKLANAPADILSDVPLIEGLETTKATAAEINQAVIKGKQTEEGINEAREIYRPVAAEASVLYFMLLKLNRIEYSYQYSLASFTTFFHNGMERGVMSDDPKKRVDALLSSVRWTIFQWVSRGLFEKHRLVFLVQLTIGLLQQGLAQRFLEH